MVHFTKWRIIVVLLITALAVLYAAPNLLGKKTLDALKTTLPAWAPVHSINLGLDLQGGSHLLLEVDIQSVINDQLQSLLESSRTELRKAQIGYTALAVEGRSLVVTLRDGAQMDTARELIRKLQPQELKTLPDDGLKLSFTYSDEAVSAWTTKAVEQSIEIVRRRVDETGTKEPAIQKQGSDRILLQLPGVDNPDHVKHLLGQTAKMTFQMVDTNASAADVMAGKVPSSDVRMPSAENPGAFQAVQRRVMVNGDTLTDARATMQDGQAVVSFKFNADGARKFAQATRENVGKPFAIVLDNKVISSPVIREPITGGSGIISGHFTVQSANELALLLRAGALPAPLNVIEERTVGAGLGADAIQAGQISAWVGFAAVVVLMIAAYGLFGIFSVVALIFNITMIFAALSLLGATLTLPGIAGIVLTIGMAVDANVLIFERIREESRAGRSVISAIDAGYQRAFTTVFDSNMTHVIAGCLMFILGSGPVRGFAVTLTIGILTSLFSATELTRLMVIFWLKKSKAKAIPI